MDTMSPICAIMEGRLDDWLKKVMDKKGIITDPGNLEWAGVAVVKKAYAIYKRRGFRTRLLTAAYRNQMQWSELIGGDISMTIPLRMAGEVQQQRRGRCRADGGHQSTR